MPLWVLNYVNNKRVLPHARSLENLLSMEGMMRPIVLLPPRTLRQRGSNTSCGCCKRCIGRTGVALRAVASGPVVLHQERRFQAAAGAA